MPPRQTNLSLLVALLAASVTGALAFAAGTPAGRAVVVAHAVAGIAVVVLSPWKSAIVRRGLRRRRGGTAGSLALTVLVTLCVATGMAHAAGVVRLAALTSMQLHVGAALIAMPLLALHVLALATRAGGEPLSAGHGAPGRLVAPGRRGFWWVKWVETVRTDPLPWWWQPPFPLT